MVHLLERWDAIELFCRLVSVKHDIPLDRFQNNGVIAHWLEVYSGKDAAEVFSKEITGKYKTDTKQTTSARHDTAKKTGKKDNDHVRFIYKLGLDIRRGRPVIVENFTLHAALNYIGDNDFLEIRRRKVEDFILSHKQRILENTKWWIYFYDELIRVEEKIAKTYIGVSKGILELKPFAKASLVRLKRETGQERMYTGLFQLVGDEQHLSVKMKIKNFQERDLRMLFYIGSDEVSFAIGLAAHVSEGLYARNVLIERIKPEEENQKLGFFSKEIPNDANKEIPDHVWLFFEDRGKSMIEAPKNITSVAKLYDYLKEK